MRNERTEPQGFEVELDDGEEVLVVVAVSVAVEVGAVLVPFFIRELVPSQFVGDSVGARGQRDDFRASGVDGEEFEDVAAAVVSGELGGVDRLEDLCVRGWMGVWRVVSVWALWEVWFATFVHRRKTL